MDPISFVFMSRSIAGTAFTVRVHRPREGFGLTPSRRFSNQAISMSRDRAAESEQE